MCGCTYVHDNESIPGHLNLSFFFVKSSYCLVKWRSSGAGCIYSVGGVEWERSPKVQHSVVMQRYWTGVGKQWGCDNFLWFCTFRRRNDVKMLNPGGATDCRDTDKNRHRLACECMLQDDAYDYELCSWWFAIVVLRFCMEDKMENLLGCCTYVRNSLRAMAPILNWQHRLVGWHSVV